MRRPRPSVGLHTTWRRRFVVRRFFRWIFRRFRFEGGSKGEGKGGKSGRKPKKVERKSQKPIRRSPRNHHMEDIGAFIMDKLQNYKSVEMARLFSVLNWKMVWPTGFVPMIALVLSKASKEVH